MNKIDLIPILQDDQILGYETNNVSEYMHSIGKLEAWEKWFVGQTGAKVEGKFVVYKTDVDRFLQGLPDFDMM